jgi:hypothetical protein
VWPTLDQARLLRLEFQPERLQAVSHGRQDPLGITTVLEAEHTNVRTVDDHHRPWVALVRQASTRRSKTSCRDTLASNWLLTPPTTLQTFFAEVCFTREGIDPKDDLHFV